TVMLSLITSFSPGFRLRTSMTLLHEKGKGKVKIIPIFSKGHAGNTSLEAACRKSLSGKHFRDPHCRGCCGAGCHVKQDWSQGCAVSYHHCQRGESWGGLPRRRG